MKNPQLQTRFLIAFLLLAGVAAVLWAAGHYTGSSMVLRFDATHGIDLVMIFRWAALAAFCGYAFLRRSLTPWVFAGMLIGAEIGYDFPHFAANLQVLSTIFLRLVKTIVSPLIFSTLVVGIAGHSNLKQVGRMGIKALIYFEVITTLALFIGLAAINLSQAGAGIPRQETSAASVAPAQPEKAADVILKVFPENIAKSVA